MLEVTWVWARMLSQSRDRGISWLGLLLELTCRLLSLEDGTGGLMVGVVLDMVLLPFWEESTWPLSGWPAPSKEILWTWRRCMSSICM